MESPKKPSRVDSIACDETDCKLINGGNESHQGVVNELKEHPDEVASARSISSLEASAADASVNDVVELPYLKLKEHPDAVASARSISSLEASAIDASVNDVGKLPHSNRRCCSTEKSVALPAENGSGYLKMAAQWENFWRF